MLEPPTDTTETCNTKVARLRFEDGGVAVSRSLLLLLFRQRDGAQFGHTGAPLEGITSEQAGRDAVPPETAVEVPGGPKGGAYDVDVFVCATQST